jgi:hypothetical protein
VLTQAETKNYITFVNKFCHDRLEQFWAANIQYQSVGGDVFYSLLNCEHFAEAFQKSFASTDLRTTDRRHLFQCCAVPFAHALRGAIASYSHLLEDWLEEIIEPPFHDARSRESYPSHFSPTIPTHMPSKEKGTSTTDINSSHFFIERGTYALVW